MAKPFSPGLVLSGLLIAALLAISAYYTYRTQTTTIPQSPAAQIPTTNTTPFVTSTPRLSCQVITDSLVLGTEHKDFVIADLVPVQIKTSRYIYPTQSGLLTFNAGHPTLIKVHAQDNTVILPLSYTASTSPLMGAEVVSIEDHLYLFNTELWGLGSGVYHNWLTEISNNEIKPILIPKAYSPIDDTVCPEDPEILECPGGDGNPTTATELIGHSDAMLIFKTGYSTSSYAGFDTKNGKWQNLKSDDRLVVGLKPRLKSLAKLFKTNLCLVQESSYGSFIFSTKPIHKTDNWRIGGESDAVDIYWISSKES